jgi:nicotinate-nucleotide adenylyltransferase
MGGAFDPVHYGHLRTALELQQACSIAELRFIPSANPPHRAGHVAPGALRVQMLTAALQDCANTRVDTRELERGGPSYTVLTLRELRAELGETCSLSLMLGMDAFLGLPQWEKWHELVELAHIIVAHRPGWQPPQDGPLGELLRERRCDAVQDIHAAAAGGIWVQEVTQLEISSSIIRAQLGRGFDARFLMPGAALQLAQQAGCYASSVDSDA